MTKSSRTPFAYLRRSNAGSVANGNGRVSFDVQREAVLDLARKRGDEQPEIVVEWGKSGAAAAGAFGGTGRGGKRRAYLELRTAIEADRVSALYAYSLSRLARSTKELLALAESCAAHAVPIRLAKEGDLDPSSSSGRLYLTVLAAVATFEAEVAAERSRDRNESMRERGAYVGRQPYGFDIVDGALVPNPERYPIVERVLALHDEHRSAGRVARALNNEGVLSPTGTKWRDGTVRRILARQPGYVPPATVRGSRAVPTSTFARLVACPVCESMLNPTRKRYVTASGEHRVWTGYTCGNARYDRTHPKVTVPERVVRTWAIAEAARFDPHRKGSVLELRTADDRARRELEEQRAYVVDVAVEARLDRTELARRLAVIDAKIAALDERAVAVEIPAAIDWMDGSAEAINAALRAYWSRIVLGADGSPTSADWKIPADWLDDRVEDAAVA